MLPNLDEWEHRTKPKLKRVGDQLVPNDEPELQTKFNQFHDRLGRFAMAAHGTEGGGGNRLTNQVPEGVHVAKPDPEFEHFARVNAVSDLIFVMDEGKKQGKVSLVDDVDPVQRLDAAQNVIKEQLKEAFSKGGELSVRVPLSLVQGVLRDGAKNQFETGTSKGLYNPNRRREVERKKFGIAEETPGHDRPIYGYLHNSEETINSYVAHSNKNAHQYGNVRIVLKDEVRNRSTFSVGDSLDNGRLLPSYAKDPHIASANRDSMKKALYGTADGPATFKDFADTTNYVEAQIFGGVKAKDIKMVYLPDPKSIKNPFAQKTFDDTEAALRNAGIRYKFHHEKDYQRPIDIYE